MRLCITIPGRKKRKKMAEKGVDGEMGVSLLKWFIIQLDYT